MLFKRKLPVWQWDDRFGIYLHFDPGPAPDYLFTYTIPSDRYVQLIAGSWFIYTVVGGTNRQVRLYAWRGQRWLYAPVFGRNTPAGNQITEHFGMAGFPQTALIPPNAIINQLIPNCYLYPDDRITIELINPTTLDMIGAFHLTFKYWNV